MKLCLLLAVAVLVELASSNPVIICKKDEYELMDMCTENCKFKEGDNLVLGTCIVSSVHRYQYKYSRRLTKYYECWKCTDDPL